MSLWQHSLSISPLSALCCLTCARSRCASPPLPLHSALTAVSHALAPDARVHFSSPSLAPLNQHQLTTLSYSRPQIAVAVCTYERLLVLRGRKLIFIIGYGWEDDHAGDRPGVDLILYFHISRPHMTIRTCVHLNHPSNRPECPW